MSTKINFVVSYTVDPLLEETLSKEGWLEFSSSERNLLELTKKKLQRKLDSARSIEDFRHRFKKIPTNSPKSIEKNLGVLKISRKYDLRVDKFLARYLGFSHLLVGNKFDDQLAIYVTSSKNFVAYLKVVLGRTSLEKFLRVLNLQITIDKKRNSIGHYFPSNVDLGHAFVLRPYVVAAGQNGNCLINCEPSLPAISKRLGLKPHGIARNKTIVRLPHFEEVRLDRAHYPYSRKEELFFHALHWTFPKAMKAIDQMRDESNSTLLINENLNQTVRDELVKHGKRQLGDERVRIVDYATTLSVRNLSVYSAEYQSQTGAFVYFDKAKLIEIVESTFSDGNHTPFSLPSKNVLLLREGNARNTFERGIRNWSEIQELLFAWNFTLIDLGRLTFFQQMQIYKDAENVVGLHGGHFSQMFHAKASTNVVEIFSGLYSRCFRDMANQYGLRYHSITAEKQEGGWHVDPQKVLGIVKAILS